MIESHNIDADEPFVDDKLLPAWFTARMMTDIWTFGLMTTTGVIIAIEQIDRLHQDGAGNIWIDAKMCHGLNITKETYGHRIFMSPTERTEITINAAHIIAAFELADT